MRCSNTSSFVAFFNDTAFRALPQELKHPFGAITVLSISFEVDVPTGKVDGSVLFERRCLEMLFSTVSREYLGLKNNQN